MHSAFRAINLPTASLGADCVRPAPVQLRRLFFISSLVVPPLTKGQCTTGSSTIFNYCRCRDKRSACCARSRGMEHLELGASVVSGEKSGLSRRGKFTPGNVHGLVRCLEAKAHAMGVRWLMVLERDKAQHGSARLSGRCLATARRIDECRFESFAMISRYDGEPSISLVAETSWRRFSSETIESRVEFLHLDELGF